MAKTGKPNTPGCEYDPQEYRDQRWLFGLENTGFRFNHSLVIRVKSSDGTFRDVAIPVTSGWGPQMVKWEELFLAAFPESCYVERRWYEWRPNFLPNQGGAGAAPSSMSPNVIGAFRGQYIEFNFCAGEDAFPVSAEVIESSNPSYVGKQMLFASEETDPTFHTKWVSKDKEKCPDCWDGEEPHCPVPVEAKCPEFPEALCTFQAIDACDIIFPENPDDDTPPVKNPILVLYTFCVGELPKASYFTTDDDGNAEDHELLGLAGNCETCLTVEAEIECPKGAYWNWVQTLEIMELFDNSYNAADGSPMVPRQIPSGEDWTIRHIQANGDVNDYVHPAGENSLFGYKKWFDETFSGCRTIAIGANHPKFPFGPYGSIPWGVVVPEEVIFAGAFAAICCESFSPMVDIEVIAASGTAAPFLGLKRPVSRHTNPEGPTKYLRAITCDGVFFKDCSTLETIAGPPQECKVEPCTPRSILDDVKIICLDPCRNVSTYIFGRPPAGQPWKWGPYSEDNLVAFEAALRAAGYQVIQIGEKHSICPPFGAFGEDPTAPLTNEVGTSQPIVEENYDPDFVPQDTCALQVVPKGTNKLLQKLCDKMDKYWGEECDDTSDPTVCDYSVEFKSSGLDTITTDKGIITITPPNNDGFDTNGIDASTWASAQSQIQTFLDANGGGNVVLSYPLNSILNISIIGSSCVFMTANHSSNPGPHEFTKTTGPLEDCNDLTISNFDPDRGQRRDVLNWDGTENAFRLSELGSAGTGGAIWGMATGTDQQCPATARFIIEHVLSEEVVGQLSPGDDDGYLVIARNQLRQVGNNWYYDPSIAADYGPCTPAELNAALAAHMGYSVNDVQDIMTNSNVNLIQGGPNHINGLFTGASGPYGPMNNTNFGVCVSF